MTGRLAICVMAACLLPAPSGVHAETLKIGYLNLRGDMRHAEQRSYAGIILSPAADPYEGAELAVREARILARTADLELELQRVEAEGAEELEAAAAKLSSAGVHLVVADLPAAALREVSRSADAKGLTLLNVSATEDSLRGSGCSPHVLHVVPSRTMLSDALAQYLASRRWNDVLVLQGPQPADAESVAAFERSGRRFGLEVVEIRPFTQSNDPRTRGQNRLDLLTGGLDYDVIFVADRDREFGRHVAYASHLPRPVVGGFGLRPATWSWAYERHGAPQLNRRFEKRAGRHMTGADWAAWAAVSLVVQAAAEVRSPNHERVLARLRDNELTFDTYKGAPGSFRAWDNQLRQPILLATADAVIARAPVDGFLHPTSYMDTLGVDQPESQCRLTD